MLARSARAGAGVRSALRARALSAAAGPDSGGSGSRGPLSAPLYVAGAKVWEIIRGAIASGGSELTVGQLLETRRPGRKSLFAVAENDSAHTALSLMLQHHVSCVAVLREDSEPSVTDAPPALVGMLTLSDFLERVALPKADADAVQCGQVMTPAESVAYVFADNSLQSCLSIMAEVRCHHLPVLSAEPSEGGVLLGVVAMEELLGLTAEARSQSRGALADTIARLPGLAAVPSGDSGSGHGAVAGGASAPSVPPGASARRA